MSAPIPSNTTLRASPSPERISPNQSNKGRHRPSAEDAPDIAGGGEGEQQTGKQDRRRGELELSVLAVVHIGGGNLHEQQHRQNHVNHGKYHIVDDGLHLPLGGIPGALDGSGHVARGGGAGGDCHKGHKQGQDTEHGEHSYNSFLTHETSILSVRSQNTRYRCFPPEAGGWQVSRVSNSRLGLMWMASTSLGEITLISDTS